MQVLLAAPAWLVGSVIDLNAPGKYLHWGFIQISLSNLLVIVVMIVLFAVAIALPFPRARQRKARRGEPPQGGRRIQ